MHVTPSVRVLMALTFSYVSQLTLLIAKTIKALKCVSSCDQRIVFCSRLDMHPTSYMCGVCMTFYRVNDGFLKEGNPFGLLIL